LARLFAAGLLEQAVGFRELPEYLRGHSEQLEASHLVLGTASLKLESLNLFLEVPQ
jgi:hypothetical protein